MGDKDFQIKFSAKDNGFGSAIRGVKSQLDALGNVAGGVAAAFTGGIIGGGAIGAIVAVIDRVAGLMRDTASLVTRARDLDLSTKQAIGITSKSRFVGRSPEATLGAIDTVQQARAEALSGDTKYVRAFQDLGIGLDELANTKVSEIFDKVAEAFKGVEITPERKLAAQRLFGGAANEVLPYANKSGAASFRADAFESSAVGYASAWLLGSTFSTISTLANGQNKWRADDDPVSTFNLERNEQAWRLRTANQSRAVDLIHAQLPLEEKLTRTLAERLDIEQRIASTKDPLRRERLVGRLLDLDSAYLSLRQEKAKLESQIAPTAPWSRNLDDMSRAGLFTGGRPSEFVDITRQQLAEEKRQTDYLSSMPERIANRL